MQFEFSWMISARAFLLSLNNDWIKSCWFNPWLWAKARRGPIDWIDIWFDNNERVGWSHRVWKWRDKINWVYLELEWLGYWFRIEKNNEKYWQWIILKKISVNLSNVSNLDTFFHFIHRFIVFISSICHVHTFAKICQVLLMIFELSWLK